MRKASEYISYTSEEKNELWKTATFIFDTNIFLNLYRYTRKTRDLMFKAFASFNDRIWMPNHVAHEIMNNRCQVICETNDRYTNITKEMDVFMHKCMQELRLSEDDEDYVDLKNYIADWIKKNQKSNQLVKTFDDDTILNQLLIVFDGKVGKGFSEEELDIIKKDGVYRFSRKTPPGFRDSKKQVDNFDNNAYGDLIVWKEILKYAKDLKKDIIYVTNDKKEDWWYIINGKTVGPRVELRKEFEEETQHKFHMYTMTSFIKIYESNADFEIAKSTMDEIELFSRVIHRVGTKQELRDYYDTLADETRKTEAKMKFKIMKLNDKNRKRINCIAQIKMNHPDWKFNDKYKDLVISTKANIEKSNIEISRIENKLNILQNL